MHLDISTEVIAIANNIFNIVLEMNDPEPISSMRNPVEQEIDDDECGEDVESILVE